MMKLLQEAKLLLMEGATYSVAEFDRLLELRNRARGEESRKIGALVESFIAKAGPDVLLEIVGKV